MRTIITRGRGIGLMTLAAGTVAVVTLGLVSDHVIHPVAGCL